MSLYDYERSRELELKLSGEPFYALLMVCFRRADTRNYEMLKLAFPHVEAELKQRYHSPGGVTPAEAAFDDFEKPRRTQ